MTPDRLGLRSLRLVVVVLIAAMVAPLVLGAKEEPVPIGSRLELFVDDYLIESMDRAHLELHRPQPREMAIMVEHPWEGRSPGYVTVFQDDDIYRMYYRGIPAVERPPNFTCYAESRDGKTWTKPEVGLWAFQGSTQNNIIWPVRPGGHNLAVFRDANPDPALGEPRGTGEEGVLLGPRTNRRQVNYPRPYKPDPGIVGRYKALGGVIPKGIHVLKSDDAIRWTYANPNEQAIVNGYDLDSQNTGFWDTLRGEYRIYFRHRRDRKRDIMTATSKNLLDWTESEPVFLEYEGTPQQDLYTNSIMPYYRAPHLFIGFPRRITQQRRLTDDPRDGLTDSLFMSSRDGQRFRLWGEAIIRPGLSLLHWRSRTNTIAWGLVETEAEKGGMPRELSIYVGENTERGGGLRRYTYRMDGFVSVQAPLSGGEVVTRPLVFEGNQLALNVSTSAAGSVRVEIQDETGRPLDGYSLRDSETIYGDAIERVVRWRESEDVGLLEGHPVRLRFVLHDADVFSFQFKD